MILAMARLMLKDVVHVTAKRLAQDRVDQCPHWPKAKCSSPINAIVMLES
jgi:hypothetical protein